MGQDSKLHYCFCNFRAVGRFIFCVFPCDLHGLRKFVFEIRKKHIGIFSRKFGVSLKAQCAFAYAIRFVRTKFASREAFRIRRQLYDLIVVVVVEPEAAVGEIRFQKIGFQRRESDSLSPSRFRSGYPSAERVGDELVSEAYADNFRPATAGRTDKIF